MSHQYDVVVIGSGLGGLTAAAILAKNGRSVLVLERNSSIGGAASTYRIGDLTVEASLHGTSDPRHPHDPKHRILRELGVLDAVQWVPAGSLFEVRGGPVGKPFLLPDGFAEAREALCERFPGSSGGVNALLGEMETICRGIGRLTRGRDAFHDPRAGYSGLLNLWPLVRDWKTSLGDMLRRHLGADEAAKFALAANLAYYHDDPGTMSWPFYAIAQGGYLQAGGHYIRGGSRKLAEALAGVVADAGGEVLTGRTATALRLNGRNAVSAVTHHDGDDGDLDEVDAPVVLGNAAPQVLAGMLPEPARDRFLKQFAGQAQSTSLFSGVFGLSVPGSEFGINAYSTFLLPPWMKSMDQYRDSAALMASLPGDDTPAVMIVDYSQIDSGLGGPPYLISVVGLDRISNWDKLDRTAYEERRAEWGEGIIAILDREFPGFSAHILSARFVTPRSIERYLNAPEGAIYGFAPRPPAQPIWKGVGRSPTTSVAGLYLASAYAGTGGFTGSIVAGAGAASAAMAYR